MRKVSPVVKKDFIDRKVSVTGTFRRMVHGDKVLFTQKMLGYPKDSAISMAVFRLNKAAGRKEYVVQRNEKGNYLVERH